MPRIASVVNINHILCNERHNAEPYLWRQGGFIDNYCKCDCGCRLRSPGSVRAGSVDVPE